MAMSGVDWASSRRSMLFLEFKVICMTQICNGKRVKENPHYQQIGVA